MNKLLSVLALAVLASNAQAGGDNRSFIQCGVKLGGTEVAFTGQHATSSEQRKLITYRTGLIGSDASGISEVARAKAKREEKRLPPTVTVAQFGCSW